jgi:uncharacterized protein (TIGR00369 family)
MARANEIQSPHPLPAEARLWTAWAEDLPASTFMRIRPSTVERGRVLARLEESIWPLNPNGAVHGGLVLAVADHVGGMSAMTVMDPGEFCATATLASQFVRPAILPLEFDATVTRSGRTLAFVSLDVVGRDGRLCTRFTGTWSLNLSRPAQPSAT